MAFANSLGALEESMLATKQTAVQSVMAHGESVHETFKRILTGGVTDPFLDTILPKLRGLLIDGETIRRYQVYHDCGKPACSDGKGHFPSHAERSADQWLHLFPHDRTVADLMRKDMLFHIAKGEESAAIWRDPLAPTLYLTAWAELFSNAEMFGGQTSDSFKIKRKRLVKAGKKIRRP